MSLCSLVMSKKSRETAAPSRAAVDLAPLQRDIAGGWGLTGGVQIDALSLLRPENRHSKGACLGIDPLSWALLGIDALTVSRWRAARTRVTKRLCTLAQRCAHVSGHKFAPLAFQKPRLGSQTQQTALYTFPWVLARLRPFGRDKDFTETNDIGVRVFTSAATHCGLR